MKKINTHRSYASSQISRSRASDACSRWVDQWQGCTTERSKQTLISGTEFNIFWFGHLHRSRSASLDDELATYALGKFIIYARVFWGSTWGIGGKGLKLVAGDRRVHMVDINNRSTTNSTINRWNILESDGSLAVRKIKYCPSADSSVLKGACRGW